MVADKWLKILLINSCSRNMNSKCDWRKIGIFPLWFYFQFLLQNKDIYMYTYFTFSKTFGSFSVKLCSFRRLRLLYFIWVLSVCALPLLYISEGNIVLFTPKHLFDKCCYFRFWILMQNINELPSYQESEYHIQKMFHKEWSCISLMFFRPCFVILYVTVCVLMLPCWPGLCCKRHNVS